MAAPPLVQSAFSFCPPSKRMKMRVSGTTDPFTSNAYLPSHPLHSRADSLLGGSFGKEGQAEPLWQHFFADPSQWCDNRFHKRKTETPDFQHKTSKHALWIDDGLTPSWVHEKLPALTQTPSQESSSPSPATFSTSSISNTSSSEAFNTKQLWEEFFSDPSQWWDNRTDNKKNPRTPDFRHKTTKKALWISNKSNPPDIRARLAVMVQYKEKGLSGSSAPAISGKTMKIEQLWQKFFLDPSQWWDNRLVKKSPKFPDFRHKSTHEGLWIEDWLNPPWLDSKLATINLGRKQFTRQLRSRYNVDKICQEGRLKEALDVAELMVQQNTQPPINTCGNLLRECTRKNALTEGMRVHALILQSGLDSDVFLGNTLVDMYAKCGSVLDARKVFDNMPKRNIFSWTAIISAYADRGQGQEAINLFQQMQAAGIALDKVVCVIVLKSCAGIAALDEGKQLHRQILESGFESDVIVGSALVDMYAKCGRLEQALEVFNSMPERNVVTWNALIVGYTQQRRGMEALALHEQMKQEGVKPDSGTFVVLLKACASAGALEEGKQLHSDIIRGGHKLDVVMGSALVDMYAKCGQLANARQVFDSMHERNIVSWNAMIAGYAQQSLGKEALTLYEEMKQEGVKPDDITYVVLLKACASIAALEQGKHLHSHIIKSGVESNVIVGSALIDMYAKCGSIEDARKVFSNMNERDVVSWSAMIAACAQQGLGKEAVSLLDQMLREGNTKPNEVTYISVLSACSHSGLIDEGLRIFNSMCNDQGVTPTVDHYACIVDLLGRAGHLADAEDFIHKMPIQPDVVV